MLETLLFSANRYFVYYSNPLFFQLIFFKTSYSQTLLNLLLTDFHYLSLLGVVMESAQICVWFKICQPFSIVLLRDLTLTTNFFTVCAFSFSQKFVTCLSFYNNSLSILISCFLLYCLIYLNRLITKLGCQQNLTLLFN